MDIGLDLDGVVANPYPKLDGELKQVVDNHIPFEKWDDPVFENMFPELDGGWIGEKFSDPAFWEHCEVFPGAVDWVNRAMRRNRIYIVTARAKCVKDMTKDWLKRNNILHTAIYHVDRLHKPDMLHSLNVKFMIEDDPRNAKSITDTGMKCYILNKPYNLNQDIGKAIRIESLEDI
jgi:5'(3')-deoxyribonucleotidase